MNHTHYALVASLCLLAPAFAQDDASGEGFLLEVKPQVGKIYRFKIVEDRNSERSRAGQVERHDERVVRIFRIEPTKVEEQGTLCRFELESMVHEVSRGSSQARYDSNTNPSAKLKRERKVGVPVDFVITPQGRIHEIRPVDNKTGVLTPSDQTEIREGWLRHSLQAMFTPYPTRKMKVGDTWTTTSSSTLAGTTVSFRSQNTISEDLGNGRLRIKQDKTSNAKPGGAYRENKTVGGGDAVYDTADGLLHRYTLTDEWTAVRLSGVRWERKGKTTVTRLNVEGQGEEEEEPKPEDGK